MLEKRTFEAREKPSRECVFWKFPVVGGGEGGCSDNRSAQQLSEEKEEEVLPTFSLEQHPPSHSSFSSSFLPPHSVPKGSLLHRAAIRFVRGQKKKKKEKEKVFFSLPHFKPRLVSSEENPE